MRTIKSMFILLVTNLLVTTVLYAAPAPSGFVWSTGVISGSAFGTKTTAAPEKSDDFEGGSNGSNVTGWTIVGQAPTYSNTSPRTGNLASRHNFVSGAYNSSIGYEKSYFTTFYANFWVKVVPSGNYSRNYKPWRFYGINDRSEFFDNDYCDRSSMLQIYDLDGSGDAIWVDYHNSYYSNTEWRNYEIEFVDSTPGVADGRAQQWVNGVDQVGGTALITRLTSTHFNQFRIGHYWGHESDAFCAESGDAYVYVDDVYIDNTLARVTICEGNNWSTKGHCEYQPATSWGASSITVSPKLGTLTSGGTGYLYVVDSTGAYNNTGLSITLGESSTITCYPDVDGDLYPGSGSETVETCSTNYYESGHFTALTADCDDTNAAINPGAADSTCDGIDQDCSGADMNGECTAESSFASGTASMTSGTASIIQ